MCNPPIPLVRQGPGAGHAATCSAVIGSRRTGSAFFDCLELRIVGLRRGDRGCWKYLPKQDTGRDGTRPSMGAALLDGGVVGWVVGWGLEGRVPSRPFGLPAMQWARWNSPLHGVVLLGGAVSGGTCTGVFRRCPHSSGSGGCPTRSRCPGHGCRGLLPCLPALPSGRK